jgi:hypothetical protein
MSIKSKLSLGALVAAAVCAPVAHAAYVATFQGVTFTFGVVDTDTLSFRIQNALSTTNSNWAPATQLSSFSIKDIGLDFNTTTSTAWYTDPNPDIGTIGVKAELNASGCATQVGQTGSVCYTYSPRLALTDDMNFTIDFSNPFDIADIGPHLKIRFTDDNGRKVGSLYSANIPFSSSSTSGGASTSSTSTSGGTSTSGSVPSPGTSSLALLGLALVGGSLVMRRKASQN